MNRANYPQRFAIFLNGATTTKQTVWQRQLQASYHCDRKKLNQVLSINCLRLISIFPTAIYVTAYFATKFHSAPAKLSMRKNTNCKDSSAKPIQPAPHLCPI